MFLLSLLSPLFYFGFACFSFTFSVHLAKPPTYSSRTLGSAAYSEKIQ